MATHGVFFAATFLYEQKIPLRYALFSLTPQSGALSYKLGWYDFEERCYDEHSKLRSS